MSADQLTAAHLEAETERRVLATIMVWSNHHHAKTAIEKGLAAEHFSVTAHRRVFECIIDLSERNEMTDAAEVARALGPDRLEEVGGFPGLLELTENPPPTSAHLAGDIAAIRAADTRRRSSALIAHAQLALKTGDLTRLHEIATRLAAAAGEVDHGRKSTALGEGMTAASLCATPPETPPELIAGLLYGRGTMMLSGPSKSRKTYTFLDLGLSVATGTDWLGFRTTRQPVLYLNFELAPHSLERRIRAIAAAKGIDVPDNLIVFNLRGRTVTVNDLTLDLPAAIKRHGAGLVIVDPWYKVSAVSGAEENSNDGQAKLLSQIEGLTNSHGAALTVGHHFAKGDASAKNSIDRAAGAGAMARWGDVIATLSEHEESDAMTLEMHLRDFAPVPPLVLRWEQPVWHRDDTLDPAKLKKSAGRTDQHPASELLALLVNGMSNVEWRNASGWSETTYRKKRDELTNTKKARCTGGLYYRT
jgi:hypothetical protein